MQNRFVAVTSAALVVVGLAGCSSQPAAAPPRAGTLPAGTAKVTINGADVGTSQQVSCAPTGPLTTITTGNNDAGVTALVSNAKGLVTESVTIRNLGGFTGSYEKGLGNSSELKMIDQTYSITGTADGFNTANPSARATGSFAITVAC